MARGLARDSAELPTGGGAGLHASMSCWPMPIMIRKYFGGDLRTPMLNFAQLLGLLMNIPGKKLGLQRLFDPPPRELLRA